MGYLPFVLAGLVIPLLMVFLGGYFLKHPPKPGNLSNGYSTPRSRSSRAAWDFAQKLFAKVWRCSGKILLPLSLLPWLFTGSLGSEGKSALLVTLILVQCAVMCLPFPIVESALSTAFDEEGAPVDLSV